MHPYPMIRTMHFDMHTQREVYDVGKDFDAAALAQTLMESHVKYINFFARCNRGFSYYPTKLGVCHPSLGGKDMLGDMLRECHKRGIGVSAYVNSIINEAIADLHPEWTLSRGQGTKTLCLNTPYCDHLLAEAKELFELYPDLDGYFLDCIGLAAPCKQDECITGMKKKGLDAENEQDIRTFDREIRLSAVRRIKAAIPSDKYFFCNGIKEIQDDFNADEPINTHYEVESLPGCGNFWGYDCLPTLAAYNRHYYDKILYMAGRFHRDWTDFGAMHTPAAIEYDAFSALAYGTQITMGDCIHPRGTVIKPLTDAVKEIYAKVEGVEPLCEGTKYVPEIAVYCTQNRLPKAQNTFINNLLVFKGAARVLAELKYQFDIVTYRCDLSKYPVLILPDNMTLDKDESAVIDDYIKNGGSVISTGYSALNPQKNDFALPQWAFEYTGEDNAVFSYFSTTLPGVANMPLSIYKPAIKMKSDIAESLADYIPSYNVSKTEYMYFQPDKPSGESAVLRNGSVTHISFLLFTSYAEDAFYQHKYLLDALIKNYLPQKRIESDLPSFARASLTACNSHTLLHLLCCCAEHRKIPVIEEAIDLYDRHFKIKTDKPVSKVYDAQTKTPIAFTAHQNEVCFTVDKISGHRMFVLEY